MLKQKGGGDSEDGGDGGVLMGEGGTKGNHQEPAFISRCTVQEINQHRGLISTRKYNKNSKEGSSLRLLVCVPATRTTSLMSGRRSQS